MTSNGISLNYLHSFALPRRVPGRKNVDVLFFFTLILGSFAEGERLLGIPGAFIRTL